MIGIMASFTSRHDFGRFARELGDRSRVGSVEAEEFLRAVAESAEHRKIVVERTKILWRAQRGCDWENQYHEEIADSTHEAAPFHTTRMVPDADHAADGRASPKGTPCLYLATDEKTAMSEVRPWLGSYVTLAVFETIKDLTLVDCTRNHEWCGYWGWVFRKNINDCEEPTAEDLREIAWGDIDHAFAKPISQTDGGTEYVPTQVIAGLFKKMNTDGIVYKSKMHEEGFNVALFETDSAKIVGRTVYKVVNIEYKFEEEPMAQRGRTVRVSNATNAAVNSR